MLQTGSENTTQCDFNRNIQGNILYHSWASKTEFNARHTKKHILKSYFER
jgi:hypothetical protein